MYAYQFKVSFYPGRKGREKKQEAEQKAKRKQDMEEKIRQREIFKKKMEEQMAAKAEERQK